MQLSTSLSTKHKHGRKIIHIDMDCFYAAVEIRDNPSLKGKPVGVGGSSDRRGVLCTCNYEARQYGIHSAMATSRALTLCKDLIVLPVNFPKYRAASKAIQEIFRQYTDKIEPLSLDEAYLDVSECELFSGSATFIAQDIRQKIFASQQLTASAGIASNKMLAKIASDWNKPNGQFSVTPNEVSDFIKTLPVKKLPGVGKVTADKLQNMQIETCGDLQQLSIESLAQRFGKFGLQLYSMCRGIDERELVSHRESKSLSTEETFDIDIMPADVKQEVFTKIFNELEKRFISRPGLRQRIKSIYVKIKFSDFSLTTIQQAATSINIENYIQLFRVRTDKQNKAVRLIGFGVHFHTIEDQAALRQLSFNFE